MKKLLLILPIFFSACYVNERGVSARYYNDCREFYDASGMYHKVCDENIIDFADIKKFPTKKSKNHTKIKQLPEINEEEENKAIDELEKQLDEESKNE